MRSRDLAVAAVLFLAFVVMVGAALRYPAQARLVPLVVGIPGILLSGWQLSREVANRRPEAHSAEVETSQHASTEGSSIAWLVAFALAVLAGGFVIGGTLAVMGAMRFWLRESWRTTLTGGGIALLITYACFERALGLVLYGGWIAGWM